MQAWLQAYHGSEECEVLKSGTLDATAGSIQAAVNLEIQNFDIDFIDVKIEGLNGQLPSKFLFTFFQHCVFLLLYNLLHISRCFNYLI